MPPPGASAAVSRAASSPTGLLLQNSRLFSIPKPLPHVAQADRRRLKGSDTSTLPFPAYQAITTPQSSRTRGDWGLKRNLPLRKTTRTSTPAVRVIELDSIEKVTDFASAADHTQSLAKWQQLNISLSHEAPTGTYYDHVTDNLSAFDATVDNTSEATAAENAKLAESQPRVVRKDGRRVRQQWKHEGPAIPHLTPSDFDKFVRTVKKREDKKNRLHSGSVQSGFIGFLRQWILDRELSIKQAKAMDEGRDLSEADLEIPEEEMTQRIYRMRDDLALGDSSDSDLYDVIAKYLQLPAATEGISRDRTTEEKHVVQPPRSTHPSAGLSYLRSHAVLENHPILGPRLHAYPAEARILHHANSKGRKSPMSVLGVGGFVANDATGTASQVHEESYDPDIEGGQKTWVRPTRAAIGPNGRVVMSITRMGDVEVHLRQGELPPSLPLTLGPNIDYKKVDLEETKGHDRQAANELLQKLDNFLGSSKKPSSPQID